MKKRRYLLNILLALLACTLCIYIACAIFVRSPKWVIDFNNGNMAYLPLVEDNHHAWLAASYSLMDWDKPSIGIEKQLAIIDTSTGQVKYKLEQDPKQNLESVSPDRPTPIMMDNILYRFTFQRDAEHQYCELRSWDFTKSAQEQVLQTWKSIEGMPMSAEFGTPKEGSCPFIVQTSVHLPLQLACACNPNLFSALGQYVAWHASSVYNISTLPLPGEGLVASHLSLVHSCMLEAGSKKVVQRSEWFLPLFHWCWPPMIDPQGNWVMYSKYHFDSERYEPLVYRCQDGRLLPFVTHPGQFTVSGMVNGMIGFGGDYLYRVEGDRVNVLKIADIKLLNAKVKRKLIGDGDAIYEFDNVDGMLRIYGNDPGKVAARVSYRESGFYSDMPFLAKGKYVYAWGVADSRPRFIRQVARQFPIVNRVWPKAFSGTIVQVDTVTSSISVLGNSLDPAYIQGMQQNYIYAFKYVEKEKGRILQQLQCWDAMVGEIDLSTYIALAILSFALTLFVLNYFTKRFWSVPQETSVQQEQQEIVGSDQSEPHHETPHPSPTREEGNQSTPTHFP